MRVCSGILKASPRNSAGLNTDCSALLRVKRLRHCDDSFLSNYRPQSFQHLPRLQGKRRSSRGPVIALMEEAGASALPSAFLRPLELTRLAEIEEPPQTGAHARNGTYWEYDRKRYRSRTKRPVCDKCADGPSRRGRCGSRHRARGACAIKSRRLRAAPLYESACMILKVPVTDHRRWQRWCQRYGRGVVRCRTY